MDRRAFLQWSNLAGLAAGLPTLAQLAPAQDSEREAHSSPRTASSPFPQTLLLKDYRPPSIYKILITEIPRAKHPVIDMHSHPYAKTAQQIDQWVRTIDEVGIEKTIILTMTTGAEFDDIQKKYSKYPERFEMWCGFDFTDYPKPGFPASAVKELERCHQAGARAVGEIHDKGKGLRSGKSNAPGMHPDDPRVDALFEKCGELGMPISLHVADPIWMYQKMDRHNDGLMNAYEWRLDNQPGIVDLSGMIEILQRTLARHPNTTFIACHFANLDYDLARLGGVLDRHPNLHADIAARYAETAPIPRFAAQFYEKHASRLVLWNGHGNGQSHVSSHLPHPGVARRALLRNRPVLLSLEPQRPRPQRWNSKTGLPRQRRAPARDREIMRTRGNSCGDRCIRRSRSSEARRPRPQQQQA
ncbi:MAG TPA: amidohydrolase family protein [Candidatus Sulfotelmatobacter sp.]|nr:amidohydrolase family protein [Candidatus Sulfotelmatobacter sp.]